MTTSKHTFVELSDVISLRVECKECHCSLLILLKGNKIDELSSETNKVMAICPTCSHTWTVFQHGVGWDSEIKDLIRSIRTVRQAEDKFGCRISFEISEEEKC